MISTAAVKSEVWFLVDQLFYNIIQWIIFWYIQLQELVLD